MIDGLINKNRSVVRKALIDANVAKIEMENSIIDDAISYFERTTDHEATRVGMKDRFAVGIDRIRGDGDNESGYYTYRRGAIGEAIDSGLIETLSSGVAGRIICSLANLFNSDTQSWSFLDENGKMSDDAETLINDHRYRGKFGPTLVMADKLSCAINGSFVFVGISGDHLKYHVVSPSSFNAIYHATINDGGTDRAVDYSEIEDATVIVLKLSDPISVDPTKQQYLAIFGRSEVYPYGRHVVYRASKWDSIPDVGEDDSFDYLLDNGDVANPLSYLAATHPDESIPEYPIIKLDGGLTMIQGDIVTTSTSLYENCIEFDIAYSRLLKDSLNSARGRDIISNKLNLPLPRSTEGMVSLLDGQDMKVDGRDASNSVNAMSVLESCIVNVSGGYNVPGYMVVSSPAALGEISGVALMIRTAPLIDFRNFRISLNEAEIDRLWEIEKNMLRVHMGDTAEYLSTIQQSWDPGKYIMPEDNKSKTERLAMAQDSGYIDYVAAVKSYHNLATDDQAKSVIDKYNKRANEYSAPGSSEQNAPAVRKVQPVGLTFGQ